MSYFHNNTTSIQYNNIINTIIQNIIHNTSYKVSNFQLKTPNKFNADK